MEAFRHLSNVGLLLLNTFSYRLAMEGNCDFYFSSKRYRKVHMEGVLFFREIFFIWKVNQLLKTLEPDNFYVDLPIDSVQFTQCPDGSELEFSHTELSAEIVTFLKTYILWVLNEKIVEFSRTRTGHFSKPIKVSILL